MIDTFKPALGQCTDCLRLTWTEEDIGRRCQAGRPYGLPCVGVFERR